MTGRASPCIKNTWKPAPVDRPEPARGNLANTCPGFTNGNNCWRQHGRNVADDGHPLRLFAARSGPHGRPDLIARNRGCSWLDQDGLGAGWSVLGHLHGNSLPVVSCVPIDGSFGSALHDVLCFGSVAFVCPVARMLGRVHAKTGVDPVAPLPGWMCGRMFPPSTASSCRLWHVEIRHPSCDPPHTSLVSRCVLCDAWMSPFPSHRWEPSVSVQSWSVPFGFQSRE